MITRKNRKQPLIWCSSDYSHPGHQRAENEDAVFGDARFGIWCVADGMGGHQGGRLASQLFVNAIASMVNRGSLHSRVQTVENCIFELNHRLFQQGERGATVAPDGRRQTIGCTFVVLLSDGLHCTCLWAGDSRLYLLRRGNLYQITDDHSVVSDLVSRGIITADQAETHPQRHVVTRALGADENIQIAKKTFVAEDEDCYLLCSDGLYNELDTTDIALALGINNSRQSCRLLMDKALSREAADNLSACVVNGNVCNSW